MYPEEFEEFFDAMRKEMQRHGKKKGDTWKNPSQHFRGVRVDANIPTDIFLKDIMEMAFHKYFVNNNKDELVDISNICAMLWLRETWRDKEFPPIKRQRGVIAS